MHITDIVRVRATGERERITAFYKIRTRAEMRYLAPCAPDDPDCAVIGTYAICGRFHRR